MSKDSTFQLPTLSLYVHIPWCVRKCPYCDFNSHASREALPESAYITALLTDLEQDRPLTQGRPLHSIFIGGGTPSLFSPEALHRLLEGIRYRIPLVADAEITLEANPGTAEQSRFSAYRRMGINRLSLGIQSFEDEKLQALGRIHGRKEAIRAVEMAHFAGFENINLDLMHGLPGQSHENAIADLRQATLLVPQHISWYQLTIEPNTSFWNSPPSLPEDETLWEIQERGQAFLASQDYGQYEISAYAKPGAQCRHNLNYWQFGDYLGIGAGAHGKISSATARIQRYWKTRIPEHYLQREPNSESTNIYTAGRQSIPREELTTEFAFNALRLTAGVPSSLFCQRTGLSLDALYHERQAAEQAGLLRTEPGLFAATPRGLLFLNNLLHFFMP